MKPIDILRVFCKSHPDIEKDINIAVSLIKSNKLEHAGEKYRDAARKLLSINMTSFAIDYYTLSSDLFLKCENYQKAINTEITIYNIHKLNNNVLQMALSHEKIASFYKHYLENYYTAGWYYLSSAKHHEDNQNYRSAFKKALFASECYGQTKDIGKRIDSHSFAFRMALQSGYLEKAGEHALNWYNLVKKDYSSHHLSVCVKGFKTFQRVDRDEEALMFVNEIIHAHFEANIPQNKIVYYLIEAQKLNLRVHKAINIEYNKRIIEELESNTSKISNYSLELRQFSENIGLTDISDFFYIQEKEYKRLGFKNLRNFPSYLSYSVWKITCLYGTSLFRWLSFSVALIIFFGFTFSSFPCPNWYPDIVKNFLYLIHPEIKIQSINNLFSPFYYSIVTFTTLGYGDIIPNNLSAQIFSVIEVITGYLMLGGLLTVFSKKIIR